jgi:hypothetical protein
VWCGFGFIDLDSKLILKWFWKTNIYIRKEKKKKNELTFLPVRPGGLEARSALACSLLSLFALGRASRPWSCHEPSKIRSTARIRRYPFGHNFAKEPLTFIILEPAVQNVKPESILFF